MRAAHALTAFAIALAVTAACDGEIASSPVELEDAGRKVPLPDAREDERATTPAPVEEPSESCGVPDVLDFTPSFKTPAPFNQGKCSDAQADALLCLFDAAADQAACSKLVDDPSNDDCFKCIYTASSSKELGPVIITGSLGSLNIAGCIARVSSDVTDQGCGAKVQAFDQCVDEACNANMPCPESEGDALEARKACEQTAGTTVCASFAAAAHCADVLIADGGAAHVCAETGDFVADAKRLAHFFCGGIVVDGGADGMVDAGADGG